MEYVQKDANNPTVTYRNPKDMPTEIKNYTDVTWLFNNYFGEYGVPEGFKPMVETELMMIANGFALQYARGEDEALETSMSFFDEQLNMMMKSGMFSKKMDDIQSSIASGIYNKKDANKEEIQISTEYKKPNSNEASVIRELAIADSLDNDRAMKEAKLVEDYNLPYKLPNKKLGKVLFVDPTMGSSLTSVVSSVESDKIKVHRHKLWNKSFWDGDVVFCNKGATGYIDHVALVDVNDENHGWAPKENDENKNEELKEWLKGYRIIESNTEGVKHVNIAKWEEVYNDISGYFVGKIGGKYDYRRKEVLDYAYKKVGYKYSIWSFKDDKPDQIDSYYCSLLIWDSYYNTHNLDLDDNGGAAVLPEDIIQSKYVITRFTKSMPDKKFEKKGLYHDEY